MVLALYDQRADRCARAQARFGVNVFANLESSLEWDPEVLIISTPPGAKGAYIDLAFERGMHHLGGADNPDLGSDGQKRSGQRFGKHLSCSLNFLPVVKGLRNAFTIISDQCSVTITPWGFICLTDSRKKVMNTMGDIAILRRREK